MALRRVLRVATRGSPLALFQAHRVIGLISAIDGAPPCETVIVQTTGDRLSEAPIETIGGQGAFVKEVSSAVIDGRADIAVHSAKDLPAAGQGGLVLAAVPERQDPRDAMVGSRIDDLAPGACVATGSVRRRAQLAWLRPDLTFCELRGNMKRRVERSEAIGAGVLAMAALERLGMTDHVREVLEPSVLLPQVGQGALAVECRDGDTETLDLLALIDEPALHKVLSAERAFLAALGSGCSLPCGALGAADGAGVTLQAVLASRDGHVLLRREDRAEDPEELGSRLAAGLLSEAGGSALEDWATVP